MLVYTKHSACSSTYPALLSTPKGGHPHLRPRYSPAPNASCRPIPLQDCAADLLQDHNNNHVALAKGGRLDMNQGSRPTTRLQRAGLTMKTALSGPQSINRCIPQRRRGGNKLIHDEEGTAAVATEKICAGNTIFYEREQ